MRNDFDGCPRPSVTQRARRTSKADLVDFTTYARENWTALPIKRTNKQVIVAKAVVVIALWSFLGLSTHAANWYVDNAASGANNGTSWANAWRAFSAVVWGSSGVKAGDTLYISGGSTSKTYAESWSVGASGTATSPITITIDASNANHNGTVIFDYNADGDSPTRIAISLSQDYIVIDGVNVNATNHIQMKNLRNVYNNTSARCINGAGTGTTIDHLTFINNNNPIRFAPCTGIKIRNC